MTIPDGRVTAANQTACEMFGMSTEELCRVGRPGISDPEDPRHAAAVAERARTGKIRAELSYVRKDGTKFTGEVSSVIVGGKGLQSFVSVRDITERKQAEEALRESEKKFRTLFERAYDAIIVTDPTGGGGIISVNPAACNMFGYSEEEFLDKNPAREAIVDTSDPNLATFLKDRDEKGWAASELTYKRKDGTCFVGDVSSAFYTDRDGNRLAVAIIRDITERKRSEAEIARLASFPMLNPNPFIEVDLAGVIHFCNPAAEKMFPDFLQREREHPLLADWETVVRSVCEGGLKESIRELEIDGRWYQEALYFVEETKRIHIYGRDITLRKEAEKELMERAGQLEEVNKDLESFGFSIGHDLRAPLRAITGYAQMILKKQGERYDEETRRRFQMITDNAEAMGRLIDDLLAFSRLGSQAVAKTSLDMEKLAGEVWQELRNINPGREMTLKIGPMPTTCGDRALIRQVYSNLLGNAVKFTQGRDPAMVEAGSCIQDDETVYYVRDNGIGFDMRFYDKLFGVFQRLHGDEEYKGTGIGLALVQRIILRHGGRLWAEGEVDKGATFYFTLPTRQE
jgi:PAS domain S-box-containing protein